jgi:hypothetical protein
MSRSQLTALVNIAAVAGIVIGLYWRNGLSYRSISLIAVFTLAWVNLMFAAGAKGRMAGEGNRTTVWNEFFKSLYERPTISALFILVLWRAANELASMIAYIHIPGTSAKAECAASALFLAILLAAAFGIWVGRKWAWWSVLVFEALFLVSSVLVQLGDTEKLDIDLKAIAALTLLFLPTTRRAFPPNPQNDNPSPMNLGLDRGRN